MSKRFRAGMIGAGTLCESHLAAVRALPDVELIGITDLDRKRGMANGELWGTIYFNNLDQMVDAGANVIHVLTPPASHAKIAKAALEKGCHVLIEKPVTDDEKEALEIARLAQRKGLVATVNHSLLYDPQVKNALEVARSGALGDIVSVDVLRGAEYPPYEGGPLPPRYRTAGYPFRDAGVHGLYLMQELLGDIEDVDAEWQSLGGEPNLAFDEWRATVRCKRGLGQLQLSYNMRPLQSRLTIHGTTSVLSVDLLATFHGKRATTPLPKAAERLIHVLTDSFHKLVPKEAQASPGLRELVGEFYKRLETGGNPPVAVEDAAQTVHWLEKVARAAEADHKAKLATFPLSDKVPFLVTGASGNLGRATVQRLREQGHRVRVLVRRIPAKPQDGVEYCFGDLGDPDAVDRAVEGAETVIHAGAAMKGGWLEHRTGTVIGTQNVIDACWRHKTKQLVHISSMSVVDWAGMSDNGAVNETANLEPRSGERGAYTRAKLEAEKLVAEAAAKGLPCVILRPGQIFGGGIPLINGAVARSAGGRWLVLGDGKLRLPLVYIDDVVDAIVGSVERRLTKGEIIQLIDPESLTQADVLGLAGGNKPVVRVPRPVVFALGRLSEIPLGAIGKPSPIAVYRLKSALARLHYESDRATTLLDWRPRVGVREGIKRVM
jgi:predicted dehydrogenase/nucleoside-diphosphate-sugar epimerase